MLSSAASMPKNEKSLNPARCWQRRRATRIVVHRKHGASRRSAARDDRGPGLELFHWSLVVGFSVAYLTEDDLLTVHVWAGYVVGLLIVARICLGLSRLTSRALFGLYLRSGDHATLCARSSSVSCPASSRPQQAGPLAGLFTKDTGEAMEGLHEILANVTLALILAHVAAVVLASFVHRENWSVPCSPGIGASNRPRSLDRCPWTRRHALASCRGAPISGQLQVRCGPGGDERESPLSARSYLTTGPRVG